MNRRESILLVEDDIPLRRMLSLALRLEGYLTFEAGDGLQAIALLDQFQFDAVGSSRVDLQACKLEYSIVSPK